jgi:hypothetical protein
MKKLLSHLLLLVLAPLSQAADTAATKPAQDTVFREPFTLNLHIDKENFYEQKFSKIPYVHNGNVYLFKGDEFGLTLDIKEDSIRAVKYQPDVKKADVTLKFTQNIQPDKTAFMMLVIHNGTEQTLNMDALMTVPGKKGVFKSNILPIQPGLSDYESWPHPIVQLMLRNIRIQK